MNVLKYENYEVTIAPEALQLIVFREIWERDKSKDKRTAKMELAYIYFMEDVRSDYMVISDKDRRSETICLDEGMPKTWKPDKAITDAMEFYRSKQPEQALWLEAERKFIDKLERTMDAIDPGAMDSKGRLINPLNQTAQLVETVNKAISSYNKTQKEVFSDIQKEEKVRGSVEKSDFENLNTI